MNKRTTTFNCPICQIPLVAIDGGKNTTDGVTVYCDNLQCSAQEVFGHGNNENNAFEIIRQKYKPTKSSRGGL